MPELYALVYQNFRRVRVQWFPNNVFSRILGDRVEVIAVFHHKRDPKLWKSTA